MKILTVFVFMELENFIYFYSHSFQLILLNVNSLQIMSVLEYNKDLNFAILDHKTYLEKVYGGLKVFDELLESFNIQTPFRMDLEAESVARSIENNDTLASRKKRKRKLHLNDQLLGKEISFLQEKLKVSQKLINKHFPHSPTISTIRENNRTLREKVRVHYESLLQMKIPDKGKNDSNIVIIQDEVAMPSKSEFQLLDLSEFNQLKIKDNEEKFDVIVLDPPW